MESSKKQLLKNYLSNLQVNLIVAEYIHCSEDWQDIDYIPEYNKFYFIYDGEGMLKIGEKVIYPKPGQLVLMPQGVLQSYSTNSKNTFTKHWCHFTATVGNTNLFDILQLPYCIEVPDKKKLQGMFEELITHYKGCEATAQLKIKSILFEMIAYFIDNTVVENIRLSDSTAVEKLNYVLDYIENHISENITIEQLARLVHFHPNYFIKLFRQHFGSSPIHYINKIRLERAKSLLNSSEMNISKIAEATGFNDVFYFSKIFKNLTGFSPSEFRNIRSLAD